MTEKQAKFTAMTEGTAEDWQIIAEHLEGFSRQLPQRILTHLEILRGDYGGFPIDRLEHCLQTATRAHRDGRDDEYVVCALLHDIGDTLGPANHADVAAVLLEPYVSEENHWIVKHHGIFQGYYFFDFLGLDRNLRDQFKDEPYFQACVDFCHRYDQNSFDPEYASEPLAYFVPMVEKVFSKVRKSIYNSAEDAA
ncbi:HD domain-containing protein [Aestuariicella hydrocarbonica]|uniref:HD domain-containing protein n=1 Tax=Pseudomaricurvus hydrocarbonicus TaxID=1470433 RepID=A0A9E5JUL9_9GAMM|nr:HD domain-containing protein [Aestuariicella hydrocarbonica]NHO64875.1 HD domain-containing protein [Aestuariicella hydrocarbonica]